MISNLTNMVCVHDQNSIDTYLKESPEYSSEFLDNTIFCINSESTNINNLDFHNFKYLNFNIQKNKYQYLNKYIGKFSGLLFLFSRPDIINTDYVFYRSCGWHYRTLSAFKLMKDAVLTGGYLTQNRTAYDVYEQYNDFLKTIIPLYIDITKDPYFKRWILFNTYKIDVNNIYSKKLFKLYLNKTDMDIIPCINKFIEKYPEYCKIFDFTIHLFVLHFSYMLMTNSKAYTVLEYTYNSPDRSLHKNTP